MGVKVSVLCAIGGENELRQKYFPVFLDWLIGQTYENMEVIVVEVAKDKALYERFIYGDIKYQLVKSDVFCKPWGMNIAANMSSGDILVCTDAGIAGPDDWIESISLVQEPFFFPMSKVTLLSYDSSMKYISDESVELDLEIIRKPSIHGSAGPALAFSRDFFFNSIGGWCEFYTKNKKSDNDICFRSIMSMGIRETGEARPPGLVVLDKELIHFHHGGQVPGDAVEEMFALSHGNPNFVSKYIVGSTNGDVERRNYKDFAKMLKTIRSID